MTGVKNKLLETRQGKRMAGKRAPKHNRQNVILLGGAKMRIGNVHHIGARQTQQDSFGVSDVYDEQLCTDKGMLAVVADGMGGLSDGGEISARITGYMLRNFIEKKWTEPADALLEMTIGVNDEVMQYQQTKSVDGGSTLAVVAVKGYSLLFISVGDSRIYLHRGGMLFQMNREHNYASVLDEKAARGDISFEDAQSDPQREALTSFIGIEMLSLIDRNIRPLQMMAGDKVVIMTDGVFRTLTEAEIQSALSLDAHRAAARIEKEITAKKNIKQDNYTAIILEFI